MQVYPEVTRKYHNVPKLGLDDKLEGHNKVEILLQEILDAEDGSEEVAKLPIL